LTFDPAPGGEHGWHAGVCDGRPGRTVGLARSELGVEIGIDPTRMIRGAEPRRQWVATPMVRGTICYPAGQGPDTGTLWVLKLGVLDDEHWPWDVRAYTRGHPNLPTDRTIHQFYGDQRFEAYRQLGYTGAAMLIDDPDLSRLSLASAGRAGRRSAGAVIFGDPVLILQAAGAAAILAGRDVVDQRATRHPRG